jgi:hypothetical protein
MRKLPVGGIFMSRTTASRSYVITPRGVIGNDKLGGQVQVVDLCTHTSSDLYRRGLSHNWWKRGFYSGGWLPSGTNSRAQTAVSPGS